MSEKLAVCVYIRCGKRVLGVSRKDDPHDFGLPGGKVEPGETLEEAARREALEETGLEVFDLKKVFEMEDDGHGYRTVTFSCEYEGDIGSNESGVIAWIDHEVLFEGSFREYNLALYEHLYGSASAEKLNFEWHIPDSDEEQTRYYDFAKGKDTCVLCEMEVSKNKVHMIGEPKKVEPRREQE